MAQRINNMEIKVYSQTIKQLMAAIFASRYRAAVLGNQEPNLVF